jgi:hypothetical protein
MDRVNSEYFTVGLGGEDSNGQVLQAQHYDHNSGVNDRARNIFFCSISHAKTSDDSIACCCKIAFHAQCSRSSAGLLCP